MTEITFPGGQVVRVDFDEEAHSYVIAHKLADGKFSGWRFTHGITTPLDTVPKPYLKPWAAKMGVHATIKYIAEHPAVIDTLHEFEEDYENYISKVKDETTGKTKMTYYRLNKKWGWVKDAKAAYKNSSDTSKDLGTWLHESVENFYLSDRKTLPVVTPDCQGMWDSFTEFDNFFKPKADKDGLEFFVYSLQFGYSGQGDFRGRIANKYCIGDWKTTNRSDMNQDGIDIDYFYQLGGLAQAEFERTGKWVDDLFIANFDKKGEAPRLTFASEFGASPLDCAKAYLSHFTAHHVNKEMAYKYKVLRSYS